LQDHFYSNLKFSFRSRIQESDIQK